MSAQLTDADIADFMTRWSDAIVSNDIEQMNRFVTPDWTLVDRNGIITLEQFNTVVGTGVLQHTTMTHDIVYTRRIGTDVAVVLTHGRNSGTYQGHPIQADEWVLEVLVDGPDGLRCTLTQLTPRPDLEP